ncbi:hypothetical protein CP8484711_1644, partial [Chlamydia psittaci 84-8471/1]
MYTRIPSQSVTISGVEDVAAIPPRWNVLIVSCVP